MGVLGRAWGVGCGFDIFQKFPSNSLPTNKSFQSNAQKFPHLGLHMATLDLSFTYVLDSSKRITDTFLEMQQQYQNILVP